METAIVLAIILLVLFVVLGRKKNTAGAHPYRLPPDLDPPVIDMHPAADEEWLLTRVTEVSRGDKWRSFTAVNIGLSIDANAFGLLPHDVDEILQPGLELEALSDGESVSTLRRPGEAVSCEAVLTRAAAKLPGSGQPQPSEHLPGAFELNFDRDNRWVQISLSEDGHLSFTAAWTTNLDSDVTFTFDAEEPWEDNPEFIAGKVWMPSYERKEAAPFLDNLSDGTLARLEAMMVASQPVAVADSESIDFDWFLPFPSGAVVAALVSEVLQLLDAMERDQDSGPASAGDGAW